MLSPGDGSDRAPDVARLMPVVYDELRDLAQRYFHKERPGHTLQPTALVHEAYLRLIDESRVDWNGRTHFKAVCAKVMRRVLIDYARSRKRIRRGGGEKPLSLESELAPIDLDGVDAVELNDALEKLEQLDPRQAQVVELRFFGGLDVEEVARALNVSKRTVEGDWAHAKAWLRAEFSRESP
jgi:RNA polymerase sigma factor (TIGR02999 family)